MPQITMYTKSWCPYCDRAKHLLRDKGQTWTEIDIEEQPEKRDEMVRRSGRTTVPQIWIGDRHVGGFDDLAALENAGQLDALLERKVAAHEPEHVRVLIVGSGPAGYTAAVYAARAELAPVMLAGLQFGGQLMLTTEVENYPGFPDGVTGPEMMELFQRQAERFGTRVLFEDAARIDLSRRPFRVESAEQVFLADALVIATGATAKWLGIESEKRLTNKGVSACATCDGALFRNRAMAVVGGGDTAMEEALFLTRFAPRVLVIHRRDQLRASKIMQERALSNPKINVIWDSVVEEIAGEGAVTGVRLRNVRTDEARELPTDGVFVAIGHTPNTDLVKGQLELTDAGYVVVDEPTTRTNVPGVFAAGDVTDVIYRQAVTAAGQGCKAAIDAERFLEEHAHA
jgi:thioredoxin reductase (NADPH)